MASDTSAEVFPVGEYIRDELEARGWSARDLAERMGGDVAVNELMTELYIHTNPRDILPMTMERAKQYGRGFGTSSRIWFDLDRMYHLHLVITPKEPDNERK